MDGAPAESHVTGSQIPSQLRQRMLSRAATFAEGAQPYTPALPRRRSSLFSNLSDAQHSFRSSTDSLLRPAKHNDMDKLASSDEPTFWHSSPIVFAILPAVAALTHQNGGAFATDILLILLAGWFMSKCVAVPWEWYHNAQQKQYLQVEDDPTYDDAIQEEREDDGDSIEDGEATEATKNTARHDTPPLSKAQEDARKELRREELMAFSACFLGPLLGAYLLHTIRSQFTSATRDGIISDLNLTIFVLAAEMRPFSRLVRMKNERTFHLQRIVHSDSKDSLKPADAQGLINKLAELEARLDSPMNNCNVDVAKVSAEVRQSMQHQLDALNRAVRKYEKRHMAQSIQIEARFQEMDLRLKDTLSLAAAAARTGQRPGLIAVAMSWIGSTVNYSLTLALDIALYPWRTVASLIALVKSSVFKDSQQYRKGTKSQLNGHSGISTSRMQSKSSR